MLKLLICLLAITLMLPACKGRDGDIGPSGRDGQDGQDGQDGINGYIGAIFEIEGDFTASNGYSLSTAYPSNLEVYTTDVVMVFNYIGQENGLDIWEPLPQTFFTNDNGIVYYSFNYTADNVSIFIDANFDKDLLTADLTDGLIFRIAVIPADAASSINLNNYYEIMPELKPLL